MPISRRTPASSGPSLTWGTTSAFASWPKGRKTARAWTSWPRGAVTCARLFFQPPAPCRGLQGLDLRANERHGDSTGLPARRPRGRLSRSGSPPQVAADPKADGPRIAVESRGSYSNNKSTRSWQHFLERLWQGLRTAPCPDRGRGKVSRRCHCPDRRSPSASSRSSRRRGRETPAEPLTRKKFGDRAFVLAGA